jgi:hypothetical protein
MNLNWLWISLGVLAFILILAVIIGLLVHYSRKNTVETLKGRAIDNPIDVLRSE